MSIYVPSYFLVPLISAFVVKATVFPPFRVSFLQQPLWQTDYSLLTALLSVGIFSTYIFQLSFIRNNNEGILSEHLRSRVKLFPSVLQNRPSRHSFFEFDK